MGKPEHGTVSGPGEKTSPHRLSASVWPAVTKMSREKKKKTNQFSLMPPEITNFTLMALTDWWLILPGLWFV